MGSYEGNTGQAQIMHKAKQAAVSHTTVVQNTCLSSQNGVEWSGAGWSA